MTPDPVQPEGTPADQGGDQGGSIFEPYLQSVPEEHREVVGGYLKDAEKNVNSKLQEAAELNQRFGAYKDIDLSPVPPDQLSQVLEFVTTIGSNPQAYQEWLRAEAEAAGLLQAEAQNEPEPEQDLEAYIQSRIEQAINPVTQKLGSFEQAQQLQAQEQATRDMEVHIESTLSQLEQKNNVKLTDEQQEAVLALGDTVQGNDWVEQGFAKYQALTGAAQAGLVNDKLNQPAPPLRTGGQAAPTKPKTFADVREAALQMAQNAL